jgi:hypothetical protein
LSAKFARRVAARIAAAFSPNSKYKVFWALILAGDARPS